MLALVADPKIALKIKALDAQIVASNRALDTAKTELERARSSRPAASPAGAPRSGEDRLRRRDQRPEGGAGRALGRRNADRGRAGAGARRRPRAQGSRHRGQRRDGRREHRHDRRQRVPAAPRAARAPCALHQGRRSDPLGARGLGRDEASRSPRAASSQVYPELQNGRVVADAEVPGLGNYFVGERTLVWISAGKRKAIVVPRAFVFKRFGLDYVRARGQGRRSSPMSSCRPGTRQSADGEDADRGSRRRRRRRQAGAAMTHRAPGSASPAMLTRSFISSPLTPLFLLAALALGLVALSPCRARRSRRSRCRWSTSSCAPTASRPRMPCSSSPSRWRRSSRRSTASSTSTRTRTTIASLVTARFLVGTTLRRRDPARAREDPRQLSTASRPASPSR